MYMHVQIQEVLFSWRYPNVAISHMQNALYSLLWYICTRIHVDVHVYLYMHIIVVIGVH